MCANRSICNTDSQFSYAKLVSVVIPCYSSQKYLESTVHAIMQAFSENPGYRCHLILINDGSPDATFDIIKLLCRKHPWITGVDLDHNYGQGIAKMAGIRFITGTYAVFMDDDGQHDPHAIFSLIREIDKGNDLVYAQFPLPQENIWRRAASKCNNFFLSLLAKKPSNIYMTSYFALSSEAIAHLKKLDYYAGSIGMTLFPFTNKIAGIPVEHKQRTEGKSAYTLRKLFKEWHNLIKGNKRILPAEMPAIQTVINEEAKYSAQCSGAVASQ